MRLLDFRLHPLRFMSSDIQNFKSTLDAEDSFIIKHRVYLMMVKHFNTCHQV